MKFHTIEKISFVDDQMTLGVDSRRVTVNLRKVFPLLAATTAKQRMNYEISPSGYGIHWPELDEDLSVDALGIKLDGIVGQQAKFSLTPLPNQPHVNLGIINAIVALQVDGSIKGRWSSSISTNGVFTAKPYQQDAAKKIMPAKNSVFLVHGHDESAKHQVARFVERIGLPLVILQEQMSGGMTLIEKFEDYAAKAGFASF